jgi:hypothetical protein
LSGYLKEEGAMNIFEIGSAEIGALKARELMEISEIKQVELSKNGTIIKAEIPPGQMANFRQTLSGLFSGETIVWLEGGAE